ncbi:hypothetical protein [Jeotgalibacillus aurantiacus]|uniref:hypothetical protein n=1 Tax=Jeotgalibacillus aurantiacus TaxID=2763266 RepID=UPI001D0B81C3|nr:hypothetical protein [Jeotgalibacillus aurantiacus]
MKLKLLSVLFTCVLLSGCTIGDPESYTVLLFEGESESWDATIEFVDTSEGDRPEDYLRLNYKEETPESEVAMQIKDSEIADEFVLKHSGDMTIELNQTKLSKLIDQKKNKDDYVTKPIELVLDWNGRSETIQLTFSTSVKRD